MTVGKSDERHSRFVRSCNSQVTSSITDGLYQIQYSQLAECIQQVERQLEGHHIQPNNAVAFFCGQDLQSAISLLSLLERNQGFLLLPDDAAEIEVPAFCRHLVRVGPIQVIGGNQSIILNITDNPLSCDLMEDVTDKVYVRSSGTTGTSKLIVHNHNTLRNNSRHIAQRIELQAQDRLSIPVPLHHMFGLGGAFLPGIYSEASIDIQKRSNLVRYLDREAAFRPSIAFTTPPFARLLADGRRTSYEYRLTVVAGDYLPPSTFDRYAEKCGSIVQVYGSSEMGNMASTKPGDSIDVRRSTCGFALTGVEFKIDPVSGQICCRNENAFIGYADGTGHVIENAGGWFATGDTGTLDASGRIVIRGRITGRVKRDGVWIDIQKIEQTIASLPGISRAIVIPSSFGVRGEGLVAFVVPEYLAEISSELLRKQSSLLLRGREIPDAFQLMTELPQLPSGKVDRRALQIQAELAIRPLII